MFLYSGLSRSAHDCGTFLTSLVLTTKATVNTGSAVLSGVVSGDAVVYIDQVTGTQSIVAVSWVGRRTPVHCASNGKVLLAFMDEPERERLLSVPLERATKSTVVDPAKLRVQLAEVRARGYATTMEELEEGLNAVAAPIRRADGQVVAALSVSGPAFRMRPVDLPRFARMTTEAAIAISRRLGYVERRRPAG